MTPGLKHNRQSGKPQTTQQNHTARLFFKTGIKSLRRTALPLAAGLLLGGCVVASAVDLAATTVFTVGKIAVKTTGAVVDAVIPDGKDDKKESSKTPKAESLPPQPSAADYRPAAPVYQPAAAGNAAITQ